jgi:glycosyltransferase involved in cell wall biosynthesis
MKFAFVTTMLGSPWGGSEELWGQAAAQLRLAGHEVRASVQYPPRLSEKLAALAKKGITLEPQPQPSYLSGPVRHFWNRISLSTRRSYRRLKRFRPDLVVISQGHNTGGFGWAKVCREAAIPYVIIVHCNSELWWFYEPEIADAIPSYTNARKVFCVSRGNLGLLRLQVGDPLLNGEVVWNPYNVSTEPAPAWPDESKVWRLACVARLDPAPKGHDLLLQILARPEWRERPVEVNLYGTGSCELTLRRMAALLQVKSVNFRGHVNNIRAIWEQNHMLVLPSRYEGLPLAIVEAMWCGRPAVVTDVAGNAELCTDSETGFVAPSATLPSFAEALERAWEKRTEWRRMGEVARARAESHIPKDPIGLFCARLKECASKVDGRL